jgi:hypothetical protein
VLVGVQDKLPEGPAGAAIKAVFIDTVAAEWAARLQLLALSLSTLSARCVTHLSITFILQYTYPMIGVNADGCKH